MYIKVNNGIIDKYPYSIENLKQDNPNTSFPDKLTNEVLAEWNVYNVSTGELPIYDERMQKLVEQTPEFVNDNWQKVFAVVPLTTEEISERNETIKKEIIFQVQQRLDHFAQTRGYYNITSACSYATDPYFKFSQEGQYCINARSNTWLKVYQIFDDEKSGMRPMPQSYASIEPELPILEWPTN